MPRKKISENFLCLLLLGIVPLFLAPTSAGAASRRKVVVSEDTNLVILERTYRKKQVNCLKKPSGKLLPGFLRTKKNRTLWINLRAVLLKSTKRSKSKKRKLRKLWKELKKACKVADDTENPKPQDPPNATPTPIPTPAVQSCGDNIISGSELCECGGDGACETDDDIVGTNTCLDFGATLGTLRCNNSCDGFDTTSCAFAGAAHFVDQSLVSDCIGQYDPSAPVGQRCSGNGAFDGYPNPQSAFDAVAPAESVFFRAGTYFPTAWLTLQKTGTANQKIVVKNFAGEQAIIDGSLVQPVQGKYYTVFVNSSQHVIIEGLTIQNGLQSGIVALHSGFIHIKNCQVRAHGAQGIVIFGTSDSIVERCEASDNSLGITVVRDDGRAKLSALRNLIVNNLVYENRRGNPEGADGIHSVNWKSRHRGS